MAYQTAQGWDQFRRIAAYRNFVVRPMQASALNKAKTYDLILNADAAWTLESKPEWVTLDKTSGTKKTELKLTIGEMAQGSPMREGDVVFKLDGQDFRTRCHVSQYNYEHQEDAVIELQKSTKGEKMNLMFLGDGYSPKDISEGKYLKDMQEAYQHFFAIEPYKTYREYFNAHTAIAVSPESGIGGVNTIIHNKFHTYNKAGTLGAANMEQGEAEIFEYAKLAPTINESTLASTVVVMVPNTKDYGGICYMYGDGSAIAYCPLSDYEYPFDFRGVVQHEAGGHGFGKFGDEYIYTNGFIDACGCPNAHVGEFKAGQAMGWYGNMSLSGKPNEVPWSHLIFHDKYHVYVDVFEGGYFHTRGVFRSEQNSCMNNNIPYYSTWCRELIVRRIKELAGEPYSFEEFVANDKEGVQKDPASTRSMLTDYVSLKPMHQNAPVIRKQRPRLNK